MNKLLQRIVTAAVLVTVLVVVFFRLPPAAAMILLALFVLIGAWEWAGFLRLTGFMPRIAYVVLIFALMVLCFWLYRSRVPLDLILLASLVWWIVAFVWVLRYPLPIGRGAGTVCGIMVLLPAWMALVMLLLQSGVRGPQYVLLLLTIVWAADVGAYFVGRRIGRVRLAPKVSPGKTREGALGGLVAAVLVAAAGGSVLGLPLISLLPLAAMVACVSILGDLTVSMFKRNAGVKDSGQLFPGHGGVLDRVDGVTAAAPFFVLGADWLGLIEL
jgi:phosphatidate cytidylyltransferase